jgi:hypothetical protein
VEGDEGNEEEIAPEDGEDPVQEGERGEGVQDRMLGQSPAGDNLPKDYAAIKKAAKDKIASMTGKEVMVTLRSMGSITWKVLPSVNPVDMILEKGSSAEYGLCGFDVGKF